MVTGTRRAATIFITARDTMPITARPSVSARNILIGIPVSFVGSLRRGVVLSAFSDAVAAVASVGTALTRGAQATASGAAAGAVVSDGVLAGALDAS